MVAGCVGLTLIWINAGRHVAIGVFLVAWWCQATMERTCDEAAKAVPPPLPHPLPVLQPPGPDLEDYRRQACGYDWVGVRGRTPTKGGAV